MRISRCFAAGLVAILVVFGIAASPLGQTEAKAAQSNATCIDEKAFMTGIGFKVYVPVVSGSRNCLLSVSSYKKDATIALQKSIRGCYLQNLGTTGQYKDGIDGVFGAKTTAGLKHAQNHKPGASVTPDGIYGNKTHNKLYFADSWHADAGGNCIPDDTKI